MLILYICYNLDIFKAAQTILLLIILQIQKLLVFVTGFATNIFIQT